MTSGAEKNLMSMANLLATEPALVNSNLPIIQHNLASFQQHRAGYAAPCGSLRKACSAALRAKFMLCGAEIKLPVHINTQSNGSDARTIAPGLR
jgi:hypothetical protein